jgi:hypothetical protein
MSDNPAPVLSPSSTPEPEPAFLSLIGAAELLGVIPPRVLDFINAGRLSATYDPASWPRWRIPRAAVIALAASRTKEATPR